MNRYKQLLEIGFLTGSRAFGTSNEGSDYDICYPINKQCQIDEIIKELERTPSNYFAGYTVSSYEDGVYMKLNLIPVHPHEYKCWYLATQAMKSTLKIASLERKPIKKYAVFMGIVSLFKGVLEERGCLSAYDEENNKYRGE